MSSKSIEIPTDDGLKLSGNWYEPEGVARNVAVLFLPGFPYGGQNLAAAKVLQTHGYHVLTVSMRGVGESDGDVRQVSRAQSVDDAVRVYDFLRGLVSADTKVVVAGNSHGAYVGTLLSVERDIAGLSLRVPAPYWDKDFDKPLFGNDASDASVREWRRTAAVPYQENKAFTALHNFAGPIQIIEAELDESVPHRGVQNYVDAVASPEQLDYHLMKGWPHGLGRDETRNAGFQKLLLDWLKGV